MVRMDYDMRGGISCDAVRENTAIMGGVLLFYLKRLKNGCTVGPELLCVMQ